MKKFKFTALLSMALLLAVSCNNENLEKNSIQEEAVETKNPDGPLVCQIGLMEDGTPSQPWEGDGLYYEEEVVTKADGTTEIKYYIPVVFHVFGANQGSGQINSTRLQEVLDWVNNDFHGIDNAKDPYRLNRMNKDRVEFQENFTDIKFELAKIDPDGNKMTTPGMVLYPVSHPANRAGLGNSSANNQISKIAWDNKRYMNVYITNDLYANGQTNNSGVSWYPGSGNFFETNCDRVVYNGAYLPKYLGTKATNSGPDFTSVLTHEFGHFFNLAHTFNENGMDNQCLPNLKDGGRYGDSVSDTPQMLCSANYPAYDSFTAKNCVGEIIDYGNFMNYGVYINFTKGQVARMRAALNHRARKGLWKHENLLTTLGEDYKPNTTPTPPTPPAPDPEDNDNIDRINKGETVIISPDNNLFPKIEEGTTLTVFTSRGDVVYEESNYQGNYDMKQLPKGSYIYTITDGTSVRKGSVEVI